MVLKGDDLSISSCKSETKLSCSMETKMKLQGEVKVLMRKALKLPPDFPISDHFALKRVIDVYCE